MPTCKTCGKEFHACSSCGLLFDWEYQFCSQKHWFESEEYKKAKIEFRTLWKTLNDAQRAMLDRIIGLGDEYCVEIENWEKELRDEQ